MKHLRRIGKFVFYLVLGIVNLVCVCAFCIPAITYFAIGKGCFFWMKDGPFTDAEDDIRLFWNYIPTAIIGLVESIIKVCTVN